MMAQQGLLSQMGRQKDNCSPDSVVILKSTLPSLWWAIPANKPVRNSDSRMAGTISTLAIPIVSKRGVRVVPNPYPESCLFTHKKRRQE